MTAQEGGSGILTKALKDLLTHWEIAGNCWRDAARASFEKDFIEELSGAVRHASVAARQIEDLLAQVRKECS